MNRMGEVGRVGQRRYGGVFYEEFLQELKGRRGIETYREMADNDSMIGAILYAIESLIRQATWSVNPVSTEKADVECAEFLESCLFDMQDTWQDTLSEILSFITYGWSFHEIVYKRRMGHTGRPETDSEYSDGLIGLRKLPIRAQETLYRWEYDDEDNLLGMTQMPPPSYGTYTIPMEKGVLFRTKSRKNNPEGRSVLRNAYRDWYFKKRIQEIEGIGTERDLAGLPVLTAPTGVDIWKDDPDMTVLYNAARNVVSGIRRDRVEGIVLPGPPAPDRTGWKLELLSSSGKRQFDTNVIIERYDARIAMSMMADFILLGHQQVGSFALSSDKTELFSVALGAYMDIICEAISKQVFPRLIGLNAEHFRGITKMPDLSHGDIENADLDKLSNFLQKAVAAGAITPDEPLEDYLREAAGLPERVEETQVDGKARREGQKRSETKQKVDPEKLEDEDDKSAEEAKKRALWGIED